MGKNNLDFNKNSKDSKLLREKEIVLKNRIWKRNFWIIIGYISGSLTIIILAFQIGQYQGYTQSSRNELKSFIEYLTTIKNGISIKQVNCNKELLQQGKTCEIEITIKNATSYECPLWVGVSADIKGHEYWNVQEDIVVIVLPVAITVLKRSFTFPINAEEGKYDIIVKIWYGKKSDPKQSEPISTALLSQKIRIVK